METVPCPVGVSLNYIFPDEPSNGILLIILSIILEFGSGTGWTLYPPLSTSFMNLEAVQLKYQSTMKSILIETDLCLVMCLVISIQIHFQVLISNS